MLQHWRHDAPDTSHAWAAIEHDDVSGAHAVGSVVLDMADVGDATTEVREEQNKLVVALDEDVNLTIIERLS